MSVKQHNIWVVLQDAFREGVVFSNNYDGEVCVIPTPHPISLGKIVRNHYNYNDKPLCMSDAWPIAGVAVACTDVRERVSCQECKEYMHA